MKTKFFALILLLLLGVGSQVQAQASYSITYEIEIAGEDMDPMAKMMLAGSEMMLQFKGNMSRMVMDMGAISKTIAITDGDAKKGIVLMDMMGRKMAIPMTEEDFEQSKAAKGQGVRKTNKTKKIAGYTCHQAFVSNGEEQEFEIWYTEEIKVGASSEYAYEGLDGFPLQMEVNQEGMIMKMLAKEVSDSKLSNDLFNTSVPDGYDITSQEDLGKGF